MLSPPENLLPATYYNKEPRLCGAFRFREGQILFPFDPFVVSIRIMLFYNLGFLEDRDTEYQHHYPYSYEDEEKYLGNRCRCCLCACETEYTSHYGDDEEYE